jgi:3D (Asp-Asp-Asp) domain-containing protein
MAEITNNYGLTYPEASDAVNVHNDIKKLADDVDDAISSLDASNVRVKVTNNSGSTIGAAKPVYATGHTNNKTTISLFTFGLSDDKPFLGLTKTSLNNGESGEVVVAGVLTNVNTSGFPVGSLLYVDSYGALTNTVIGGAIGIVAVSNTSTGVIVIQAKGNGTWGALKAGLA